MALTIKKKVSQPPKSPPPPGDEDYKVGYKHPPLQSRFQKGVSGNPSGRAKGLKLSASVVAEELGQMIEVTEQGQRRRVTKMRALIKTLIARALSADPKAIALLLRLLPNADQANRERHHVAEVDAMDLELLDAFRSMVQSEGKPGGAS